MFTLTIFTSRRITLLSFLGLALVFTGLWFNLNPAQAQTAPTGFSYPISELGNCSSRDECRTYCDQADHAVACLDFASTHQLMPEAKIARARQFLSARATAPGQCSSRDECETYCSDTSHLDECVTFAEQHRLLEGDDLRKAQQIRNVIKSGTETLPGNCSSRDECETYCSDAMHQEECLAFASRHELISNERLSSLEQTKEHFRALVDQAPAPVASCIQQVVGDQVLSQIKSGSFVPPASLSDDIKDCVSRHLDEDLRDRLEKRLETASSSPAFQAEIRQRLRNSALSTTSLEISNEVRQRLKESLDNGEVDNSRLEELKARVRQENPEADPDNRDGRALPSDDTDIKPILPTNLVPGFGSKSASRNELEVEASSSKSSSVEPRSPFEIFRLEKSDRER